MKLIPVETEFCLLPMSFGGPKKQKYGNIKYLNEWKLGQSFEDSFGHLGLILNQLYFIRAKTLEMHNIENETNLGLDNSIDWRVHSDDKENKRILNTILDHLLQDSNFEKCTNSELGLQHKNASNRKRKRSVSGDGNCPAKRYTPDNRKIAPLTKRVPAKLIEIVDEKNEDYALNR